MLWDDNPPETARALVQTYVSGLRRAGNGRLAGVIRTRTPGYLADLANVSLDWEHFEVFVAQGRAAVSRGELDVASQLFRKADSLWRGSALGGVMGRVFSSEADRLDDVRLTVLEERIAVEIALGRVGQLTAELAVLTGAHPRRERLQGQLMTALYRTGRVPDALAVFRAYREQLIDELGIEPGRDLAQLHEAILRQDPELLPPSTVQVEVPALIMPAGDEKTSASTRERVLPAELPIGPADFTGRHENVKNIGAFLTDLDGSAPLCVISGPGGVGKSALAIHVTQRHRDAFPDGQLYVDLRGLAEVPATPTDVLGRFLCSLGVDDVSIPDGVEERAARFRTELADRRVLLVLDDAISEAQVRPLLPGAATCAAVVTSRNRLAGLAGARLVDLGSMSTDEATEFLRRVVGDSRVTEDPQACVDIVERCGNLPLAVRIAGARLTSRRQLTPKALADRLSDERRRLDELRVGDQAIRACVELSYRALRSDAQCGLRRLALLGYGGFPLWVVAAAADTDLLSAEDLAERLVDAHLLEHLYLPADGQVRYRMHDLVRLYALEQATVTDSDIDRRQMVDRVASGWLSIAEQFRLAFPPATVAYRRCESMTLSVQSDTIETALADPHGWLAMEQESLVLAVEQAASAGLDELAVQLASALCGAVFPMANLLDAWSRCHQAALVAARRAGNIIAEATLLAEVGQLRYEQDRFTEAREYLSQALTTFRQAGDSVGESATLTSLGAACREQGYLPEALHFLNQAATMCQALGDKTGIGHCARIAGSVHMELGAFAQAKRDLVDALEAYRAANSRRGEGMTLRTLGLLRRAQGDLDGAQRELREALKIFGSSGEFLLRAYCERALAKTLLRQGDFVRPIPMLHSALAVCEKHGDRWGRAITLRNLGEAHLAVGQMASADHCFQDALKLFDQLSAPLMRARTLRDVASLHRECGQVEQATRVLEEASEVFRAHGARELRELFDTGSDSAGDL